MAYLAIECGAAQPQAGMEAALEQMRLRLRYWNALALLEQEKREAYRVLRRQYMSPEVAGYAERYEGAERSAQAEMARSEPDLHAAYRAARTALRSDPAFVTAAATLEEGYRMRQRALRRDSSLYWCNYDDVELAFKAAQKRSEGPRLHRPGDRDKLSIRFQQGLPVGILALGQDTRLQLLPAPGDFTPHRGSRRRGARPYLLRFRVGSEQRQPVWLDLPVILHRPLPMDGVVRTAAVIRDRMATHHRWKVIFVVQVAEQPAGGPAGGIISVDLGWRKTEIIEGLRVGFWSDDRGKRGEIVLPNSILQALQKCEDLRSIRDQHFNRVRGELGAWLRQAKAVLALPDWLLEETETLPHWRSISRLAGMVKRWRERRFPGDEQIYIVMEAWRKRDKILYEYECNMRDEEIRHRREIYREFAAWAARNYGTVRLERFDLRPLVRRPWRGEPATEAEEQSRRAMEDYARHYRFLGAPSTLRQAIENAARREGRQLEYAKAAWTTQTCHYCGRREEFDAATELVHQCSHCGRWWDQDDNAAKNLIKRPVLV